VTPALVDGPVTVYVGQALAVLRDLPAESVHCCVTSPPYWGLRDYGTATWEGGDAECDHSPEVRGSRFATPVSAKQLSNTGSGTISRRECSCGARRVDSQLGLEATPEEYVAAVVEVFREVRRVLRSDGTLWLNLGDSYAGSWGSQGYRETPPVLSRNSIANHPKRASNTGSIRQAGLKPKDLIGIPWRVALALQADGWWLRRDIIWSKPNPMPESVTDRPTSSHEYLFLLTKAERYFYDAEAVREPQSETTLERFGNGGSPRKLYGPKHDPEGEANVRSSGGVGVLAAGRNLRSVWTIATQPYPAAHFATYPEDLVIPCIKAGTSERGCCPDCGAPWRRVVERPDGSEAPQRATAKMFRPNGDRTSAGQAWQAWRDSHPTKQLGWEPGCRHAHGTIPGTVLDPFAGSGTTLAVARRLGRRAIGIELQPDYLPLIQRRISEAALPLLEALV
jgi:DNA modification methylase